MQKMTHQILVQPAKAGARFVPYKQSVQSATKLQYMTLLMENVHVQAVQYNQLILHASLILVHFHAMVSPIPIQKMEFVLFYVLIGDQIIIWIVQISFAASVLRDAQLVLTIPRAHQIVQMDMYQIQLPPFVNAQLHLTNIADIVLLFVLWKLSLWLQLKPVPLVHLNVNGVMMARIVLHVMNLIFMRLSVESVNVKLNFQNQLINLAFW